MNTNDQLQISAIWGNDDVEAEIIVSHEDWQDILNGKQHSMTSEYHYEGEVFTALWQFNHDEKGSVLVEYDDTGVGLDGSIEDLFVQNL